VKLTAAEYLAWERAQLDRHEFFDGEVLPRPLESPRHYVLCVRMSVALQAMLHERACVAFTSEQLLGLDGGAHYAYPDATVVCGGIELADGAGDVLANPTLLVEVLSASTERHDRGRKWLSYQQLPSLTDYLLVSQSEPRIEHYRRVGRWWSYRSSGPGSRLELADAGSLSVDAIFAGALELPGD
jgi:Uma2 family endonuclease